MIDKVFANEVGIVFSFIKVFWLRRPRQETIHLEEYVS